jgi:hypothetical protein
MSNPAIKWPAIFPWKSRFYREGRAFNHKQLKKEVKMKNHINVRLGMVPIILLSLALMPISGVLGQELAKGTDGTAGHGRGRYRHAGSAFCHQDR